MTTPRITRLAPTVTFHVQGASAGAPIEQGGSAVAQASSIVAYPEPPDPPRAPPPAPQYAAHGTTPLEQRNVRVSGWPSLATVIKSALLAALPVATASRAATQGLLDDAVSLLHQKQGIDKFMMLRELEDPANVAAVNAVLTGLRTPARPTMNWASILTDRAAPSHATHLWIQGGKPDDPDALGNRIARHHRRDQTQEILDLIRFNPAQLSDSTEEDFRAIVADPSVHPRLFFTEQSSTWNWDRAVRTQRQLAIIDNSGVPAWSIDPTPDADDVTAAHMLTEYGLRALFFTDVGVAGQQDMAARHYAAQGCGVITLPLLKGTNVTLIAPPQARAELARFAMQHKNEGVHLWEPEASGEWKTILGIGGVGVMVIAMICRLSRPRGAARGTSKASKGRKKVRTLSGGNATGPEAAENGSARRPADDTSPAELGPHPVVRQVVTDPYNAALMAQDVSHQLNAADKSGQKKLAVKLGQQLNAAMKDSDRNRVAEAAGIVLGMMAWTGDDLARLKRIANALGSEYSFEHVLDKVEYFSGQQGASPHLQAAAAQLVNAQPTWRSAMYAGAHGEAPGELPTPGEAGSEDATMGTAALAAPGSPQRRAWPQVDSLPNIPFNINPAIQEARALIGSFQNSDQPAGVDAGVEGLFIPPRHIWPHLHIGSNFIVLKKAGGKHIDLFTGGTLKGNNVNRAREYLRESGKAPEYLRHMENLLDRWLIDITAAAD